MSGLINNKYAEYNGEVGIAFPKFIFPFLKKSFRQKIRANTEFSTSFTYQERPEYTRVIAGAGWKYKWTERGSMIGHTFDLLDINYVYLPKMKDEFISEIAPDNPLLRYSYEDHFIMKMGYTFYYTNKKSQVAPIGKFVYQPDIYTFRAGIETAGNLLYAGSSLSKQKRDPDSQAYKVFGIQYSQYVKLNLDYTYNHSFDRRNALVLHIGAGAAVPYGNSTILPFEKRFYSGGANSVRGWSVRTLGPGRFNGDNSVSSFMEQCGDIRLDLNMEYRAKLFWVFEMAAFIDAGNIWTIRSYENQPGGVFKFDSFYKEIAADFIAKVLDHITYTWFDIRKYKIFLDTGNDKRLIELFKFFSPEHMLKKRFQNDSNSLNTKFYSELLYIIGLEEVVEKDSNKHIITRRKEGERNQASILERPPGAVVRRRPRAHHRLGEPCPLPQTLGGPAGQVPQRGPELRIYEPISHPGLR